MVNNWLITGGCGFIGTSLIQNILATNPAANIRILDSLLVGTKDDLAEVCNYSEINADEIKNNPNGIELVVGDIRDQEISDKASVGIECIVHLAANTGVGPSVEDPRVDMDVNVAGVFNMLEAARNNNVKRFVFASSGAPLGVQTPPLNEEMAPKPASPYGASKLAGEGYCLAYYNCFGLETAVLRFGNVYGPRSKHKASVVAKFIKLALAGKPLEIYGDGKQTRDFIFIEDLVNAIVSASNKPNIGGEVFQIATSAETTVQHVAEKLITLFKNRGINTPALQLAPLPLGDVARNYSDTSKAKEILSWSASTSLEKGLEKTLDYFIPQVEK